MKRKLLTVALALTFVLSVCMSDYATGLYLKAEASDVASPETPSPEEPKKDTPEDPDQSVTKDEVAGGDGENTGGGNTGGGGENTGGGNTGGGSGSIGGGSGSTGGGSGSTGGGSGSTGGGGGSTGGGSGSTGSGSTGNAATGSTGAIGNTASGQVITEATLQEFAANTTMTSSVPGAKLGQVTKAAASTLVSAANSLGRNIRIATMVDIVVPPGTGTATFTLGIPRLASGQSVVVLHLKSDGTIESLSVSSVGSGSVTFTMTSYSPVAVVVKDATSSSAAGALAPQTGDSANVTLIMMIAVAGLAGVVISGKKFLNK